MLLGELVYKIVGDTSSIKSSLQEVDSKLEGTILKFKKFAIAAVAAFAIDKIKDFFSDIVKGAAKLDTVQTAFKNLSDSIGVNSMQIIEDMQKASRGTIDDSDLMAASLHALELGGKAAADSLPALAEMAQAIARLNPELSAQQALEQLLNATSAERERGLKRLGISTIEIEKYTDDYAQKLGKTTEQMTNAEKTAAMYFSVTKAGSEIVKKMNLDNLSLSESLQVIKTKSNELKGSFLNGLIPGINSLARALAETSGNADGAIGKFEALGRSASLLLADIAGGKEARMRTMFYNAGSDVERLTHGINNLVKEQQKAELPLQKEILSARIKEWENLRFTALTTITNIQAEMPGLTLPTKAAPQAKKDDYIKRAKAELSEYYTYIGNLRAADVEKEKEAQTVILMKSGLTDKQRAEIKIATSRKIDNDITASKIKALEDMGKYEDAAVMTEELRYKKILDNFLGSEDEKLEIERTHQLLLAQLREEGAEKEKDLADTSIKIHKKKMDEIMNVVNTVSSAVTGLFQAMISLNDAKLKSGTAALDAQMLAEERAQGVQVETAIEAAQREYDTADKKTKKEKRNTLERLKIEEQYQHKKLLLQYKTEMANWELQRAMAAVQLVTAPLNTYTGGLLWASEVPFGLGFPILAGLVAMAAATAGMQYAAVAASKPKPPVFATGGIVPGTSYSGDVVSANVNSGEMILTKSQQAQLLNLANGGGGSDYMKVAPINSESVLDMLFRASQNGMLLIHKRAIV